MEKMKFCPRPFEHMYFTQGGVVTPCGWCDAELGNVLDQSIDEIWHGDIAERVRQSVKDQSFEFCRRQSCPFCENDSLDRVTPEEFDKLAIVKPYPVNLSFSYDYRCNHACPSCRCEIFVPDKDYKERLESISEKALPLANKAEYVDANGQGDLFACPEMMDMLENLKPENKNFVLNIETNGVLFKENWDKIKHLKDYNIHVTVTPNSYDRETYKYLCGGFDNLAKCEENLAFIHELREKGDIKKFDISTVVQDTNFRELPIFIKKSLDVYGADSVVVKPIYKWFRMSEETWWFKDIMNPKHPYHKDYMKILEDPIISDPRVYLWGAKNEHEAADHPATKYKHLLDLVAKFSLIPDHTVKLNSYICESPAKRIFLYGDNAVTAFLFGELSEESRKRVTLMARELERDCCSGLFPVGTFTPFTGYKFDKDDLIIITHFINAKYVKRDLSLIRYPGKAVTSEDVLKKIEG